MRLLTIFAMLLACALLSCSPTTERSETSEGLVDAPQRTGSPPSLPAQTGSPPATGTTALAYFGEESIEERIARRDTIVRARLDTTTVEVATSTVEGWSDYYYVALRFHLTVSEYLKGSGANSITAFTLQGDTYDTRKEAEDAMPDIAAGRVTTWDDREAIFFLYTDDPFDAWSASVQGTNDYFLSVGDSEQDMYSLHNRYRKLWLPSAGTAATGDDQEFLLAAPQQGIDTPTITLGELKSRLAAVNAELNAGDGSEAYRECITAGYQSARTERHRMSDSVSMSLEPRWDGTFGAGQPAGTEVYEYVQGWAQPAETKSRLWIDGHDAALFTVKLGDLRPGRDYDRDGQADGFEFDQSVVSVRPIPAGTYEFDHHVIPWFLLACERTYSFEMTVNVLAPHGSLHEFFFDPVTDGAAVAADATNGVLKPATFTDANDAEATISRIEWESGAVKMTVSPHTGLTDRFVDFIELDGTVSLSLAVSAATVDAANNALSWSATTQPWEDGDLLMVRIREPYAPAPTNLRSSRAGNGYLVAWNAVSGASQYALQTRIPGAQDEWTDTTPFAEEDNQWYAPSPDLWCASSYEFRVRSYGDGIRYAAQWGEPSSVLTRDGHCNNAPEFSESAYSFSVAEDASSGDEVGTVSAADLDALSYSITAGNGDGKFAIGESSGVISVAGELDHATTASYTLTVEASDGRGETDSATVEIEMLSVVVDYDADDDGLIEVSALAQLNAIRWDLDGNGSSTNTSHAAAFPGASDGIGCPSTRCRGYELTADLDFDTDGDGSADSEDDYWNDGSGWDPIGDSSNEFRAIFDGNGRSLSNLFIDRDSTDRVGLFANTGGLSAVRNVRLVSADVTGRDVVGGIVGYNDDSRVTSVCVSGDVAGRDYVGGITGRNDGAVRNGCSSADVSGDDYVGGLVGWNYEIMTNGYATGDVSGDTLIGGLVGRNDAIMTNGYATGDVTASREAGGLVGRNEGRITSGYATGDVTASSEAGGLVGSSHRRAQVSASYWDTGSSGLSASSGGVGKTTAELQSPVSAVGIYSAWDAAVWDFGTSAQYPALKADMDGDSTSTLQEFGDQGR